MNINDIRDSGLLEQYVLGLLTSEEILQVESYLSDYPELKTDLFEIEYSLRELAISHGIKPKKDFEDKLLDYIKENAVEKPISKGNSTGNKNDGLSKFWSSIFLVVGIMGIAALWMVNKKTNELSIKENEYLRLVTDCDSLQQIKDAEINMYKEITSFNTRVIDFNPTENFQETELRFHTNNATKKNYIQINGLPVVDVNEAFQLWALKPGLDPIPLDVFNTENGIIIPVQYVDGTQTYAITIENAGGAQVPNLDRLIGTAGV